MSKVIFSGLESSGKSLQLAMIAEKILLRNIRWREQSGIARKILTNSPFSEAYMKYAKDNGIVVHQWENLDELISQRDCDVFIDEIGTYFDARLWSELSLDVRRWIQQGSKMGIELYGACQDFAQVDISFRRLTSELHHITKWCGSRRPSPTKPPIKRIWGLCHKVALDPQHYDEGKKKFQSEGILNFFTGWFLIERRYCELFDTRFFLKRSKPLPYKHHERFCNEPGCEFHKVVHV